jgi:hypothetical protein
MRYVSYVGVLFLIWSLRGTPSSASEPLWKAGVARAVITPSQPVWLAGYGGKERPPEGKIMDLRIKVLALEDDRGHRAVILTSDLLGIPQSIYQNSCASLKSKFDLNPDQILLSASHTHCGPILRGALYDIYPIDEHQKQLIGEYSAELETKMVETVGRALADLAPAKLVAGQGMTAFAVNRRNNPEAKVPALIEQGELKGPVDHAVPVLGVYLPDGKLKAVLFGYACHNTVMGFNQWSGDYAGFAQLALEKSHTNATAMFFMGCGADQNPLPRRQLSLAERYGNMLASTVEEVLLAPPAALPPKLDTAMEMVTLNLGPAYTEDDLEKMTGDKNVSNQRYAKRLLSEIKAGKTFIRTYSYPLQAWRFGGKQLLVTLGGEPVVDYSLKFKKTFGKQTWVAGYCNDVMTYLPSLRVLNEDKPPVKEQRWGYEGHQAFIVYGLPAPRWADDVEDLITASARRLVKRLP